MYILSVIKRMIIDREFLELAKKVFLRPFKIEWRKKHRKFNKLYDNSQWDYAIDLGEAIIKTKSKGKDFFQKLAICYIKVHKIHEAEYYMKKSLELRTKRYTEDIIGTIEDSIFGDKQNIRSKYLYLGGRYNLGLIEHRHKVGTEEKIYLTKIIPNKFPVQSKIHREKFFNQTICERFPELQTISPKMINYSQMKREKIYLMSFNKINNDKKKKEDFQEIINISESIIQGIKYDDAMELLKVVDRGKKVPLSALMHKLSTHEFIFSYMKNKIKSIEGDIDLNKLLDRVKYIIIDLKMYKKINPRKHYVFCHRDLHKNNILYDKEKNKYYIIDWVNYGLALEGSDLARCFMSWGFTFKRIEEGYLNNISNRTEDLMIKRMFFTYDLIVLWVGVLNKDNLQEQINNNLSPAIQYMEDLIDNRTKFNKQKQRIAEKTYTEHTR